MLAMALLRGHCNYYLEPSKYYCCELNLTHDITQEGAPI